MSGKSFLKVGRYFLIMKSRVLLTLKRPGGVMTPMGKFVTLLERAGEIIDK